MERLRSLLFDKFILCNSCKQVAFIPNKQREQNTEIVNFQCLFILFPVHYLLSSSFVLCTAEGTNQPTKEKGNSFRSIVPTNFCTQHDGNMCAMQQRNVRGVQKEMNGKKWKWNSCIRQIDDANDTHHIIHGGNNSANRDGIEGILRY